MESLIEQGAFWLLSGVAIVSALFVVSLKNAVHSALMLGLSLLAVAGLFGSLGADFLFAAQIMVYVSGIAVLILFVVMIAGSEDLNRTRQINDQWAAAGVVAVIVFGALWKLAGEFANMQAPGGAEPTTLGIAKLLLGDYALPFELVSVMLMAALLGAILFSRTDPGSEEGSS